VKKLFVWILSLLLSLTALAQERAKDDVVKGEAKYKENDLDGAIAEYDRAIQIVRNMHPHSECVATPKRKKGI
jgi:hypothetical protein